MPGILSGLDVSCRRTSIPFTMQMEVLMKLVRIVKKFRPEKSLKAYAWYGWI
ncbi:tryptorubin family RiPP precursor [Streptomyces sp. NPDC047049]|uniref:tryptorubin family RiPP precursor n=1 Tax=Streptomyces sp. NPDC047049 TaxID=3156688 RepID=UPI0033E6CB8C